MYFGLVLDDAKARFFALCLVTLFAQGLIGWKFMENSGIYNW